MPLERLEISRRGECRSWAVARYGHIGNVVAPIEPGYPRVLNAILFRFCRRKKYRLIDTINRSSVAAAGNSQMRNKCQSKEPALQMAHDARVVCFKTFILNPINDVA